MVVTISPSFNLYKMVVFPAASRPTKIKNRSKDRLANSLTDNHPAITCLSKEPLITISVNIIQDVLSNQTFFTSAFSLIVQEKHAWHADGADFLICDREKGEHWCTSYVIILKLWHWDGHQKMVSLAVLNLKALTCNMLYAYLITQPKI